MDTKSLRERNNAQTPISLLKWVWVLQTELEGGAHMVLTLLRFHNSSWTNENLFTNLRRPLKDPRSKSPLVTSNNPERDLMKISEEIRGKGSQRSRKLLELQLGIKRSNVSVLPSIWMKND